MLEVLACFLVFSLVGEERCQMYAWWEVFLVNQQTLFQQRDRFVCVFLFVAQYGIIEMCAHISWAGLVDSLFERRHSFCEFSLLFLHPRVAHKGINIIWLFLQGQLEIVDAVFQVVSSGLSQIDLREFYIVWRYLALHGARLSHLR